MSNIRKLGEKYLGIKDDYSPTHKDIGDNLRAYITIIAFGIGINYLWDVPFKGTPAQYVFRGIAFLWIIWIGWFLCLTIIQTFYIYLKLVEHFLNFAFEGWVKKAENDPNFKPTQFHKNIIYFAMYVAALTGMVFMFGIIYMLGALLILARKT
jgi:hypothetical protein